jgi:hypothetical protein
MDLQYITPYRNGGPGPASPPAKSTEFRDNLPPACAIERAARVTRAACNRTSAGHTC